MSTQKTKDTQLSNSFSLEYIPVTTKNYKQAIKIQNKIFHEHFPKEIKNSCYPSQNILYNYSEYWLVKHHNKTVGITGLYSFQQYPHDVFLNWYGVVPSSRKHGFGKQIVLWTIEQAHKKGFKYFRLYTEIGDNDIAILLYKKLGMIQEKYTKEIGIKNMVIFSKSLSNKKITKWNNRYIAIWESYLLYCNNLWTQIKSNPIATFFTILQHPKIIYHILTNKL